MVKIYQKSDLKVVEESIEQQIELLRYPLMEFVDSEVIDSDKTTITIEYELENLVEFAEYKTALTTIKYRLGLSLLELLAKENEYFNLNLDSENLYVTYDLKIKQLKREFKTREIGGNTKLEEIKALIGSLFLKYSHNEILSSGNELLKKSAETSFLREIETEEELAEILIEKTKEVEEEEHKNKITVDKNYHRKNLIIKIVLGIGVILLIVGLIYLLYSYIPNQKSQLDAYTSYNKGAYDQVQLDLATTDINAMTPLTKYIMSDSTVKLQPLNEQQKENILLNLSPDVDEGTLDFWVYLGQGDTKSAYNQSIANNDAQQKSLALLLLIQETQNDSNIKEEEKQTLVDQYQSELDSLAETLTTEEGETE